MNLVIINPDADYTDAFFNWLIDKIVIYARGAIDDRKLIKIDDYINTQYKSIFKKTIRSKEVLYIFLYNLKVTRYWDRVLIESNLNQVIPSTTIKVIDVAKLINYGNLHIKGYPIIDEVFKYFKDNISIFYEMYKRGL